jgi:uncharacterized protein YbcV (DUF1398 family)
LKNIGVILYEVFVIDWQSSYFWRNNFSILAKPKYEKLEINSLVNKEDFMKYLKIHQNWWSDYMTFCIEASKTGISKWVMDLEKLTCSYVDFVWNMVLVEKVPCVD